jgi:aminoglycoside 6'-N-acetyltransferase
MELLSFEVIRKDDIPLMHSWFNEPHVQRFYSLREWSEAEVLHKLLPAIEFKNRLFGFIIFFQQKPIGYIQYYSVKDFPWPQQDFAPNVEKEAAGLDLFIGNPSFIGKGLGSAIITQFLEDLIWPRFQFCVVDPDERNLASIKLFEKCKFVRHKKIISKDSLDKTVTLLLMVKENPT